MKVVTDVLVLVFSFCAFAGTTGCKVYLSPWQEVVGDFPLVAPGEQVRAETRSFAYAPIPAGGVEDRWIDSGGRTYDRDAVAAKTEDFLKASGLLEQWPIARLRDGPVQVVRKAPFHLAIVSVRPTVVLMWPLDPSRPTSRRMERMEFGGESLYFRRLVNRLECRTSLPHAPDLWWFSPDLKQPPTRLAEGAASAEILFPGGRLYFVERDGQWKVIRN